MADQPYSRPFIYDAASGLFHVNMDERSALDVAAAMQKQLDLGREQGRAAERADVVAWLRSPGLARKGGWREEAWAKDIEEGGHVGQADEEEPGDG